MDDPIFFVQIKSTELKHMKKIRREERLITRQSKYNKFV